MSSMKVIQAAVTLLSLINPVVCALMLSQIGAGQSSASRAASATKASIAVLVILILFALIGAKLLKVFGISLDVFQVAGGLVLAWMGFSMVRASTGQASQATPVKGRQAQSLTPLILFAASPGTITGIVTLSVNHSGTALPVTAILGAAIAVLALWLILVLASRLSSQGSGDSFLHNLLAGMMGLIVIAMGFQFGMTGIKAFFAGG